MTINVIVKVFAGLSLLTYEAAGYAQQASSVVNRPENQIQLETYVVEVSTNDDLFGAVHWSNTLARNSATFALSGNVGTPTSAIFPEGAFFKTGVILQAPTVQATIRALIQRGKLGSTIEPVTYTWTGEPVQIRAVQYQTVLLQMAATANVQATTTPYTFTTGLTIDVVPRIAGGGNINLKINPAFSAQTGIQRDVDVPIISIRSARADVEIRSGDALVIGGVTHSADNYTKNGIPGLQKIPLLRYLSQSRQKPSGLTNLVIVVCPRIVPFLRHDRVGPDEAGSVEKQVLGKARLNKTQERL